MTAPEMWQEFAHDPRLPAYAPMRASDADRDVLLRALGEAYSEGRITADEFDERTTGVQGARTLGELPAYVADLVPAVHAGAAGVPAIPTPLTPQQVDAQAVERWQRTRREALRMWLFVSLICWTIWVVTGADSHPWPVYPMLGTAIPLLGTIVQRREMIDSHRRSILARHEKAVAKAHRKIAEVQRPSED